jgi:hypothetical protein
MTRQFDDRRYSASGARRPLRGVESLEGRRLLSASPWSGPSLQSGGAESGLTSGQPAAFIDTLHHGHALLTDPASTATASVGPAFMRPAPYELKSSVFRSLEVASQDLASARVRPDPLMIESRGSLLAAGNSTSRVTATPPLAMGFQSNRSDTLFNRFIVFMSDSASSLDFGQASVQDGAPLEPHLRFAELMRDSLIAARLAIFSSDAIHPGSDDVSAGGSAAEGHRRGATHVNLFGQSAESESMSMGAGRASSNAPRNIVDNLVPPDVEQQSATHAPVGHLVAYGDAASARSAATHVARTQTDHGDGQTMGSVLHDLLAPRLAFDSTAMSAAITDLLAEADDLGVGLLGMLTDPLSSGEMAILTGVAAAGFAYRHWRGGDRRAELESRRMLAARFITGCATSRVDGRKLS